MKEDKKPKKNYWYLTRHEYCVLCGRGSSWKERQHIPKPEDPQDRHTHRDFACDEHFM